MKKIRIGNDILIRWAVTRNGEAEDFTGLSTLRVSVLDEIGARQKAEYSVSGNTITIQYRGANQKKNGVYSLLLEGNRGIDDMVTLDHIDAFQLVPHSAYTGGNTCSNVEIETLEFEDEYVSGRPGLSAYEIALLHGFVGTEDEWLASLRGQDGEDGERGPRGYSGNINYPTFEVDEDMHLIMDTSAPADENRFELTEEGHLILNIE